MVNAAESDIVSPSVTAEYPLGFLSEEVFILNDVSIAMSYGYVYVAQIAMGADQAQTLVQ